MSFKPKTLILLYLRFINSPLSRSKHLMARTLIQTIHSDPPLDSNDLLCSDNKTNHDQQQEQQSSSSETTLVSLGSTNGYLPREARPKRAWAQWVKLGRPKLIVAPMVDNSELPFRILCRTYGAEAAYTPMLHSRIFIETEK